ncbi:MAG: tripartite tricarboxylate transporter substrate binding protein [Betaproteobacteria bacterium]|nr:tripartite tricarboxylate transporter substrate binding protein [Betaproteobacteria bacterium]
MLKIHRPYCSLGTAALALGLACAFATAEAAQPFPSRPIRFIVAFPPGGANDVIARTLSVKLTEDLGQQLVVDNRGGANTIIGTDLAAKAAPDGHTILIVPGSHAINPGLYPKLPYDSLKDFAFVTLLGPGAYVLVVHPAVPAKTGELFSDTAGVKFVHVPYKGGGPGMTDLIAGRISLYFATVAVSRPHIQAGRLRAIGVTTAKRSAAMPEVPTIAESGLPGYEVSGWYGIVAPAGTPRPVVNRLHAAFAKVLALEEVKDRLLGLGVEAAPRPGEEFRRYAEAEIAKWGKIVRALNIRAE